MRSQRIEREREKKIQLPVAEHTNTLAQVRVYKMISRLDIRDFFTH